MIRSVGCICVSMLAWAAVLDVLVTVLFALLVCLLVRWSHYLFR